LWLTKPLFLYGQRVLLARFLLAAGSFLFFAGLAYFFYLTRDYFFMSQDAWVEYRSKFRSTPRTRIHPIFMVAMAAIVGAVWSYFLFYAIFYRGPLASFNDEGLLIYLPWKREPKVMGWDSIESIIPLENSDRAVVALRITSKNDQPPEIVSIDGMTISVSAILDYLRTHREAQTRLRAIFYEDPTKPYNK
jgi:hypothetical protein